jgi:hypothetical protein
MENDSFFVLDLLDQLREFLLEAATGKMHGACYVSIESTLVIPVNRSV